MDISLSGIVTELRALLSDEGANVENSDSKLTAIINIVNKILYTKMCKAGLDSLMNEVLITGDGANWEYDLPSDFGRIIKVEIEGLEVDPINIRERGTLSGYYLIGNKKIGFSPKSIQQFNVIYHSPLPKMSDGTASGGGAGFITLAATPTFGETFKIDDYYNGAYIYIYGGTGIGEIVQCTDYTGGTMKFEGSFTTDPDNTSKYSILSLVPYDFIEVLILKSYGMLLGTKFIGSALSNELKELEYELLRTLGPQRVGFRRI